MPIARSNSADAIPTTLTASIGSGDLLMDTEALVGTWPDTTKGEFAVTINFGEADEEMVLVSAYTSTQMTIPSGGRGYGGTAQSHAIGATLTHTSDAPSAMDAQQHIVLTTRDDHTQYTKKSILTTIGDIFAASAASTPARVAAGAAGTVLAGQGAGVLPAYEVLPGTLLNTLDDITAHTYTVVVGTLTVVDSSALTLAFVVPASGSVDVDVQATGVIMDGTSGDTMTLALFNHSGGAQLGKSINFAINDVSGTSIFYVTNKRFHLTGLTPGNLQIDVAAGVSSIGSGTGSILVGGATGLLGGGNAEPFLMQAFAA